MLYFLFLELKENVNSCTNLPTHKRYLVELGLKNRICTLSRKGYIFSSAHFSLTKSVHAWCAHSIVIIALDVSQVVSLKMHPYLCFRHYILARSPVVVIRVTMELFAGVYGVFNVLCTTQLSIILLRLPCLHTVPLIDPQTRRPRISLC
jgi:hypothetical protein